MPALSGLTSALPSVGERVYGRGMCAGFGASGSRRRAFEFRLIRCFLVLDRQRSIVDSHFSIMLPGNWIGRPFGSLLEHTSTFGKFCCLRHRTPQDVRVRIFNIPN